MSRSMCRDCPFRLGDAAPAGIVPFSQEDVDAWVSTGEVWTCHATGHMTTCAGAEAFRDGRLPISRAELEAHWVKGVAS